MSALPLLLVGCTNSNGDKKAGPKPTAACSASTAAAATRAFVDAKGFTPSCAKTKRGTSFVFGNVDDKPHTVAAAKDSPQAFTAELKNKNSLFAVKLTKAGTYHVTATGGAEITLYVE